MKIAHISDFHARRHVPGHPQLLVRRSRLMPSLIDAAISKIKDHTPDILVVTGDLVDAPFYGMDDPVMIDLIRKDLQLIRDTIDKVGCPVQYLFGNHDLPSAFEDVFPDRQPDFTLGGYRFVTFYDEEVNDNTAERLGEERARFDGVLTDADLTPQVHLQHYMIWPEHSKGYPPAYREASELKKQMVESGKVLLSLSGHYHAGADATVIEGVCFATARAFCQAPHPYRIYDVSDGRVNQSEHTVDVADLGRSVFIDMGGVRQSGVESPLAQQLLALRKAGWSLVGVASLGVSERETFERETDQVMKQLEERLCPLDSVSDRRNPGPPDEVPYQAAAGNLGIGLAESHAVVVTEAEAEAARSAGIETTLADPRQMTAALETLIS